MEFKGFSINVSKSSPTQNIISACSKSFAWEGFNMKLCGDVLPSIIKDGSPTPFMTFEIKECRGFIVVTTFSSALEDDAVINIIEKTRILIRFNNVLFGFILMFIPVRLM